MKEETVLKSLKVTEKTHKILKELASHNGLSMQEIMENLVSASLNWVNYAKKIGIVPEEIRNINPLLEEEFSNDYSDHWIFLALYYRAVGIISEKDFDDNKEDLPFLIFAMGLENVQLDPDTPNISPEDENIQKLERELKILKRKAAMSKKTEPENR